MYTTIVITTNVITNFLLEFLLDFRVVILDLVNSTQVFCLIIH